LTLGDLVKDLFARIDGESGIGENLLQGGLAIVREKLFDFDADGIFLAAIAR
jgi:hypothetical protein